MKARIPITLTAVAVAVAAAASWAADVAAAYNGATATPAGQPAIAGAGTDSIVELKWDNGSRSSGWFWYSGANAWVGNEFDISTISSYNYIRYIRFNTYPNWPNSTYEGGRIAIYAFSGGSPGSILWGPQYRANTGGDWNDLDVYWSLGSTTDFLAAWNQFYNYPNCDCFSVDNSGSSSHGWYYYNGWYPQDGMFGGGAILIRVVVDNEHYEQGVAPASLGRVKALYF